MTRIALDTNILAYLAGVSRSSKDETKITQSREIVRSLRGRASLIAPTQALGELFVVLRRSGAPPEEARRTLAEFAETLGSAASEPRTALAAADLAVDHRLQFWDAMILSASVDAGCTMLLSEDMQDGFVTRGLTIVNPLIEKVNPKLSRVLSA